MYEGFVGLVWEKPPIWECPKGFREFCKMFLHHHWVKAYDSGSKCWYPKCQKMVPLHFSLKDLHVLLLTLVFARRLFLTGDALFLDRPSFSTSKMAKWASIFLVKKSQFLKGNRPLLNRPPRLVFKTDKMGLKFLFVRVGPKGKGNKALRPWAFNFCLRVTYAQQRALLTGNVPFLTFFVLHTSKVGLEFLPGCCRRKKQETNRSPFLDSKMASQETGRFWTVPPPFRTVPKWQHGPRMLACRKL